MIFELTLHRNVTIGAENLTRRRHFFPSLRSVVATRLLEDLASERVSKFHGYYLGVTGLSKIARQKAAEGSGDVSFRVLFKCRVFRPFKGETLHGVVYWVCGLGVFLRCGPVDRAYISSLKMPGYTHDSKCRFVSDERAAIESGVVLRFTVLAVRWIGGARGDKSELQMLGNLEGESLGPVSFPASAELEL